MSSSRRDINEIKSVIGALSGTLSLLYDLNLKPEHFRLAKFNKTEDGTVETLWNLLGKLTKASGTGADLVNEVKLRFCALKYKCVEFYALPLDMSHGSRELLLALGFLLGREALRESVALELEKSPFGAEYDVTAKCNDCGESGLDFNVKELRNEEDFANMMQWIDGRIAHDVRTIKECGVSSAKILKKLREKSEVAAKFESNVTFSQILALHDVEMCRTFLTESVRASKILDSYERWLRKEQLFWKWMGSVVAERSKDKKKTIDEAGLDGFFRAAKSSRLA